ncbi:hypothetical protein D6829_00065 [Candidatus Pacearchaeota archaeon]|nr:MAG: hypothetical protein D6829_00065 [Candidatus Pacearchaeota archaeon]
MKKEYEQDKKKVFSLFRKTKKPVIFLSHNVPYNTRLDKINNPKSPLNGGHFGSIIVREAVEKFQPPLCIGGHMHENFGKTLIGKTLVFNAGFGSNVNIFLDFDGKLRKFNFWSS